MVEPVSLTAGDLASSILSERWRRRSRSRSKGGGVAVYSGLDCSGARRRNGAGSLCAAEITFSGLTMGGRGCRVLAYPRGGRSPSWGVLRAGTACVCNCCHRRYLNGSVRFMIRFVCCTFRCGRSGCRCRSPAIDPNRTSAPLTTDNGCLLGSGAELPERRVKRVVGRFSRRDGMC